MYIVVVDYADQKGSLRPSKYQEFDTLEEANAHVVKVKRGFVYKTVSDEQVDDLVIDAETEEVTIDKIIKPTLEEEAEAQAEREMGYRTLQAALFKIAFQQENRIRVLEGKAEITAEQFKTAVKARINT